MILPLWTALNWSMWESESNKQELEELGLSFALGAGAHRSPRYKTLKKASLHSRLNEEEESHLASIIRRLTDCWSGMTETERDRLNKYLDLEKQPKIEPKKVDVVPPFDLPPSMSKAETSGIKLHPYQNRAVEYALKRKRCCLAMEMGLGKTLIALTVIHILNAQSAVDRAIIIAPKSAHGSWREHLEKYTETPHVVLSGFPQEVREKYYSALYRGTLPFLIVSPQTFSIDRLYFKRVLEHFGQKTILVIDEAHKIKTADSLIGLVVEELSPLASRVLGLTGTPQPNTISDLYYMVDRVLPGSLGESSEFASKYTYREIDTWDSVRGKRYKAGPLRADRLKDLHLLLSDIMLSISEGDEDVSLNLPPREDHAPYIPLDDLQKSILKALKYATAEREIGAPSFDSALIGGRGVLAQIGAEGATANTQALGVRIEQLSISPALFSQTFREEHPDYESPKVAYIADRFLSFLQEGGEAGVIFSEPLLGLDEMKKALVRRGVKDSEILFYTGQTSERQREKKADALNNGHCKVLLGQTKALETGCNLQHRASFVAHLSTPWSPDTLAQSTARVYRQGQRRRVIVLRPSGSRLEEAKNKAVSRKLVQSGASTGLISKADLAILATASDARIRKAHRVVFSNMGYTRSVIDTLLDHEEDK